MASRFNIFDSTDESDQTVLLSYWDKDLVCQFANNELLKFLNKKRDELIGLLNLKDILGRRYYEHHPYIKQTIAGHSQNYESIIRLRSEVKYKVMVTLYPDLENGKANGFFAHINNFRNLDERFYEQGLAGLKDNYLLKHMVEQHNRIHEVAAYLKAHILDEFPSIESLAEKYSLSVSTLMRSFKSTYKMNPYSYYRNLQMEFAKNLLANGCSKKEIASVLGFSNPANFSSCFKRYLENTLK
jgi:AraC-like DNA-binding protein